MNTAVKTQSLIRTQNIVYWLLGIGFLSLMAQVQIPLPWTPVPITGQTFAVALISLTFRRHAWKVVLAYLAIGFAGAPVFAGMRAGFSFGPTFGYLIGMGLASIAMGFLAENLLKTKPTFLKTFAICLTGSAITFTCGLTVLSYFGLSGTALLSAGLVPFIPGDLIKSLSATGLSLLKK